MCAQASRQHIRCALVHKLKTAPLCVQSRQRTLPEHRYLLQGRTEEGILETGEFSASKLELGREKGLRGKYGLGWENMGGGLVRQT